MFARDIVTDSYQGVKMPRIFQNWVKILRISHNLWVQLSLSQKLRGQFDPLHPSIEAPVIFAKLSQLVSNLRLAETVLQKL